MKTVEAAPRAASLIEGMRDFGYSLETALADVIDNSITAGARTVEIFSEMHDGEPVMAILDDGSGMSSDELLAALRPGSANPRDQRQEGDLGRFGLGLKTASYSQCRRLTVVTRKDGETSVARWDLDRVAESDQWLLEIPSGFDVVPFADRLDEQGTVVVWEKLDRLLGEGSSADARKNANLQIDEAIKHLELVFHRFIAGEKGIARVKVRANGRSLIPFDPFHATHSATLETPVEHVGHRGEKIRIQAFTLPHHSMVSQEDWRRYGGKEGYVKNQGFYVYRSGRLIIHGTWFGLARQLELTKLSRVKIDLPNSLDDDWKIDVKKASAQPPRAVKARLRSLIETIGQTSKRVYTRRGTRLTQTEPAPIWTRNQKDGQIVFTVDRNHPVIASALKIGDTVSVSRAISVIEGSIPLDSLLADLGNNPEMVTETEVDRDSLRSAIEAAVDRMREAGSDEAEIRAVLPVMRLFRSKREFTIAVLDELDLTSNEESAPDDA